MGEYQRNGAPTPARALHATVAVIATITFVAAYVATVASAAASQSSSIASSAVTTAAAVAAMIYTAAAYVHPDAQQLRTLAYNLL